MIKMDTTPQFKILVIDDQYGRPGPEREDFLARVQRDESEFVFTTGQTEDGQNVPDVTIALAEALWEHPSQLRVSLILLDVRFPDGKDPQANRFGFKLLRALRERFGRALPIVMLTTETGVSGAANEASADGFLPKENLSQTTLDDQLFRNGVFPDTTGMLVGSAHSFLLTLRELRRVVRSGVMELLLLGETGVGKSRLAQYVHHISERRNGPFKSWVARTPNAELHYDELFGHWREGFTGANTNYAGIAEVAHKGILFIDEIAELSPQSQTGLLEYRSRGVDNFRRAKRLGHYPRSAPTNLNLIGRYSAEEDRILVDTFLITATNKPINDPAWRERTDFRLDLFNRLGHRVEVPPLRERVEDIVPLFLAQFRHVYKRAIVLTADAQIQLEGHQWREGNIKEIETVVETVGARLAPEFDEVHPHHFASLLAERRESMGTSSVSSKRVPEGTKTAGQASNVGREGSVSASRLVDFEVQSLWGIAERLRTAVLETRRPGRPGTLADIFRHATGVEYPATDVKREVKDILAPWFAPKERQAARWAENAHYQELAERVRADVVLSTLYRYSCGEIKWEEASEAMVGVFSENAKDC
jgi:DNA-binding NtrC family response regulator